MATLFFSYSHKDEDLRDQLEVHLAMLKHQGLISTWHDRKITAGDDLDNSIDARLEAADVVLFLVSPDFLASRYCYDIEVRQTMQRHQQGLTRVIPVILRPCDWKEAPFAKLAAVPRDGKPVTKWPDRDEAFLDVAQQIRAALPKVARFVEASTEVPQTTRAESPRSSNLRLTKQFTEADKDHHLDEAFDYIARFFENSLNELAQRNPGIETRFKRIDVQLFTAVIYRNGNAIARCSIRHAGSRGFGNGITFSHGDSGTGNSFNESLSVKTNEQSLFLQPVGMAMMAGGDRNAHLSFSGAAEYYWSILIDPLQH